MERYGASPLTATPTCKIVKIPVDIQYYRDKSLKMMVQVGEGGDGGQLTRVAETGRRIVHLRVDGQRVAALEGDTLFTAILLHRRRLRISEFGDGGRAGFCLIGACQDCWVWTAAGARVRACSTAVNASHDIVSGAGDSVWPA